MNGQDYFANKPKSSRTGRVPKWAVDEAMGRPVEVVPFRGATSGIGAPAPPPSGRSWRRTLLISSVVALVCAVAAFTNRLPLGGVQGATAAASRSLGASGPPAGHEERSRRLAPAPAVRAIPEGTNYRFLHHEQGTKAPVTWSPCRPVHYVVRPDAQPAFGPEVIAAAFAEVASATGLRFVSDGPTHEAPATDRSSYQPDRYGKRWAPVLVAWASPDEVPDFGIDIAGEAGPSSVVTASGDATYVSGTVYLDPVKLSAVAANRGTANAQTIVMHELGHLVGLAHVNDPAQVMSPGSARQTTSFGGGDMMGLARLGKGPCQPDA